MSLSLLAKAETDPGRQNFSPERIDKETEICYHIRTQKEYVIAYSAEKHINSLRQQFIDVLFIFHNQFTSPSFTLFRINEAT